MKTTRTISLCILMIVALLTAGCGNHGHFITNRSYRKQVKSDFAARRELATARQNELFAVFTQKLTIGEKEALQFMYAYMPLADLAEYDGEFFLKNVRISFVAKEEMPWGKDIPEDIFRHYVLPVRVNNESLDSARMVFYPELKERLKGLSLEAAALEVNRWCHEKVTYKSTDGRTSAPLSTVKNAFGRCGEESVFTVAALRSAGIPARQVYTPRWAHSDDNHAWVEVWIDGTWHYMGACEPEPVLDRGWFTGPAKRAMLVHTRVFGRYHGSEEVVTRERDYAVINSTAIYCKVAVPVVTVLDEHGKAVENAQVEFGLYNYAEFYPIATLRTDNQGQCSITIGRGDIVLHATDGKRCVWSKQNFRTDSAITLVLKPFHWPGKPDTWHLDVPDEVALAVDKLPEEVTSTHKNLLASEDSIRNAYVNTFPTHDQMASLAKRLNAPADSIRKYLVMSQGNHQEVASFIAANSSNLRKSPFLLMQYLTEKDLRDTRSEVLQSVLDESPAYLSVQNPTSEYLLSPKIDLEVLKPFRRMLKAHFSTIAGKVPNPALLFQWIHDSIRVDSTPYYSRIIITPSGVHNLRVSDPFSRDIYFVAACRSIGIPARLEPATKVPQAVVKGVWKDFSFNLSTGKQDALNGFLNIIPPAGGDDPGYYHRFTLAKFTEGLFQTLEYPENQPLSSFTFPLELKPGQYSLISSLRQSNGDVDVVRHYFTLEAGKTTQLEFPVPEPLIKVFGKWPEAAHDYTGRPFIFLMLEASGEPSRHLLQELQNEFGDKTVKMLPVRVMFSAEDRSGGLELLKKYRLQGKVHWQDYDRKLVDNLIAIQAASEVHSPLTVGINKGGDILFLAGGYQINSIRRITEAVQAK